MRFYADHVSIIFTPPPSLPSLKSLSTPLPLVLDGIYAFSFNPTLEVHPLEMTS